VDDDGGTSPIGWTANGLKQGTRLLVAAELGDIHVRRIKELAADKVI
jgi:hypothetical protein